jgi:predicted RNA-binding protein with RPS1 domain
MYFCKQPSSLGVGMYQHDLSDKGITERLRNVVEDCVNIVGVDANTASEHLLRYVSGLTDANVKEIIAHRNSFASNSSGGSGKSKTAGDKGSKSGPFTNLASLLSVKGIGPKTFQNCAGFLRVYGGSEPLDATNVHPEDYELAKKMIELRVFMAQQDKMHHTAGAGGSSEEQKKKKKKMTDVVDLTSDFPASTASSSSHSNTSKTAAGCEAAGSSESWKELLVRACKEAERWRRSAPLFDSKTEAELQQIWQWVLASEVALLPSSLSLSSLDSSTARSGNRRLEKGPYMSYPKLLHGLPSDFNAKVGEGSVLKGIVRNVTTFGAFVDLGGVEIQVSSSSGSSDAAAGAGKKHLSHHASSDGLLHCSKYKDYLQKEGGVHKHLNMTNEIYVGREVMVKIVSVDGGGGGGGNSAIKQRISLDLIQLL